MALDLNRAADVFSDAIACAVFASTKRDAGALDDIAHGHMRALAQHAALVAGMIEANMFTAAELSIYLEGLDRIAQDFARTLDAPDAFTAIARAIYDCIGQMAGLTLAAPRTSA